MVKRLLGGLIFAMGLVAAGAFTQEAHACPYCAQDKQGSSRARFFLIGGLVSFPFLVVGTGIYAIRRVERSGGERP